MPKRNFEADMSYLINDPLKFLRRRLPRGLRHLPYDIGSCRDECLRSYVYVLVNWHNMKSGVVTMQVPDIISDVDPWDELARLVLEAYYVRRG